MCVEATIRAFNSPLGVGTGVFEAIAPHDMATIKNDRVLADIAHRIGWMLRVGGEVEPKWVEP